MSEALSPNTKAILLLTAPLIVGRGAPRDPALKPLSPIVEYHRDLAKCLRQIGREPADLLGADSATVLDDCEEVPDFGIERQRIEALLGRGVQLSLAVEQWQTRAIWVLSRADDDYPRRLKKRLRENAPPVLYGCGECGLAGNGGLAVVGPRDVGEDLLDYAAKVGELAAGSGEVVISGAAKGVDRAAMSGALEAGGCAVGVLASDLARVATQRENRVHLLDGRLLLISPYDPAVRFRPYRAMERNHTVYSLADAALVVEALVGRGGTWAGATAQLDRGSAYCVYVRSTLDRSEGLAALKGKGARPWRNPRDPEGFRAALSPSVEEAPGSGEQETLFTDAKPSTLKEARQPSLTGQAPTPGEEPAGVPAPADRLWQSVRINVPRFCAEAATPKAVASEFDLNGPQAEEWLGRLVEEGVLRREKRPERYVTSETLPEKGPVDEPDQSDEKTSGARLWYAIRDLAVAACSEPRSGDEAATRLGVRPRQVQRWLQRLADEGVLRRIERPVRYVAPQADLLAEVGPLMDPD